MTATAGESQLFDSVLAGGPDAVADAFGLTASATPHATGLIRPGTYAVVQTDPGEGWDLTRADCDGGVSIDAVVLAPGATVTCTFVNVKRGRIIVDQLTYPENDPQEFQFSLGGGTDGVTQSFGLTDDATAHDTGSIRAGLFVIAQQDPGEDWDLTSATCTARSTSGFS